LKELKFVPKSENFTGSVTLRMPSFDERYEVLDSMGLKVSGDGEVSMSDATSFSSIRNLVKASIKFYVSVELDHNDGRKFRSTDDLLMEPDCDAVLIEVASGITKGFKMGKT
jgi:hypothetical protein